MQENSFVCMQETIITCVRAKSSGRQLQEQIIGYIALHYELDIKEHC